MIPVALACSPMNAPAPDSPRPKYVWPWFVLGFVLLGIALAVMWVWIAAKKVEQQRDTGELLPVTSAPR